MATGPSVAGTNNAFIPNWEASGKLRVAFTRNANRFPLVKYGKIINTPKPRGYFKQWLQQTGSRVGNQNRFEWPDGKPRPVPVEQAIFNYIEFATARKSYGWALGQRTVNAADEDLLTVERNDKAMLAMTARTQRAITALTTSATWLKANQLDLANDHTAATGSGGLTIGDVSAGTGTDPKLLKVIQYAMDIIAQDTSGCISSEPARYYLVMNPTSARRMAASAEIHAYLQQSPSALARITGNLHSNAKYGLPDELYGVEILVEDTVLTTSVKKAAAQTRSYAFPDAQMVLCTKYGDGELTTSTETESGRNVAPADMSTLSLFTLEDMVAEEFNDQRNRIMEGAITEDIKEVVSCPNTGYLFTAIFTA